MFSLDEAGLEEDLQVVADRRLAKAEWLGKVAHRLRDRAATG
jgi:hypothetical protein